MDIENSTRLNVLFTPEQVQTIKNAFICTAIEIIKSFDGHVHRIMGDAVMAYFGGRNTLELNNAINAINCASVLQLFSKNVVRKKLNSDDHPFGIRLGLDYGQKDDVLWSSYGYFNMCEVTATSFYVDVASKLQHQAGRNNIMIGNSLKNHLDIPDILLNNKQNSKGDIDYFLKPNITDKNGRSINYKKFLFNWEKYLDLSVIPQMEGNFISTNSNNIPISIASYIYSEDKNTFVERYYPLSYAIGKQHAIKFNITLPKEIEYPYKINFIVENHGEEAINQGGDNLGNHNTLYQVDALNSYNKINHWEHTLYRGLHYMKIEVIKDGALKNETSIGVFIQ